MKILFPVLAIFATTLFLNACNTIDGAGEDIQAGGNAISNASENVQHGR